jgi:transposase
MYYIGADHHKRSTYMTSLDASGRVVFKGNLSADRVTLERFLREHPKPFVLGIEACYAWEYVADLAEGLGEEVRVGQPLLLKAFARKHKKNDKIDSALIAHLLWKGDFPAIVHPPKEARARRDVYRQRLELVRRRSGAIARAKALADRLGFTFAEDLATDKGIALFERLAFPDASLAVRESHVTLLRFLRREIRRIEKVIDQCAASSPSSRRLDTIPGIASYLALLIDSEVFDIRRFATLARFHAYSGVAPGSLCSGGRVYAARLSPQVNRYLRWAFIEAAPHYTRQCPYAQAIYDHLKRRKGWKTARLAIARHVATIVYHVLREQRDYQPLPPAQPITARTTTLTETTTARF